MLDKNSYLYVSILLFVIPIAITSYKYFYNRVGIHDIIPREVYEVTLELDLA